MLSALYLRAGSGLLAALVGGGGTSACASRGWVRGVFCRAGLGFKG